MSQAVRGIASVAGRLALGNRGFLRDGMLVLLASMLANAFSYAFQFGNSRLLGVEKYGELSALFALLMYGSGAASIIGLITVKYAAEFYALDELKALRGLLDGLSIGLGAGAVIIVAAATVSAGPAGRFLHIGDRVAIILTALMIALSLFGTGIRAVLQGMHSYGAFGLSLVIEAIVKFGLGTGLVFAGAGLRGALVGTAIGAACGVAAAYIPLFRTLSSGGQRPKFDLGRLARTTGAVGVWTLAFTSLGFSDVLVVKHLFSSREAGVYGAVTLTGKIVLLLSSFVPIVLQPRAASLSRRGEPTRPLLLQALAIIALLSALVMVPYAIVPKFIVIATTGGAFLAAVPLVLPYAVASVALGCLNCIATYNIAIHRFRFVAPVALVAVAELVAMSLHHTSITDIVWVLIIGHTVAIALALGWSRPLRHVAVTVHAATRERRHRVLADGNLTHAADAVLGVSKL